MIVKNEAANLPRCLSSLIPHISCYAICDTGSTDDTVKIVTDLMSAQKLPGVLPTIKFENFGQARNDALGFAKSLPPAYDYIIFSDADWQFVADDPQCFDNLTEPVYSIRIQDPTGKYEYAITRMIRRDVPCTFHGVTHEYPYTSLHVAKLLEGCHFIEYPTGAARPTKFQRDIKLLTEGLKNEPDNGRYKYYLGESHYWLSDYREALKWYQNCLAGPTWAFDAWHPMYRIAQILRIKGMTADFIHQCLATWDKHPHRAESLCMLARFYQQSSQYHLGYTIAKLGLQVPRPPRDAAHVEVDVYAWELMDVAAICAWYVGKKQESLSLNRQLYDRVPECEKTRIKRHLDMFTAEEISDSIQAEPDWWDGGERTGHGTDPKGDKGPVGKPRCLVVATIGDHDQSILRLGHRARSFDFKIINHGVKHRSDALNWRGHKWQNIAKFCREATSTIEQYDYFWFPDGDLDISYADVDKLFMIAHHRRLQLCQPSITGHVGWTITDHKPGSDVRLTNFVEIMAPLFSREALKKCLPTFEDSESGWGLDFVWAKLLEEKAMGIVDAVTARHAKPFHSQEWTVSSGLSSAEEGGEVLRKYGIDPRHCFPREVV